MDPKWQTSTTIPENLLEDYYIILFELDSAEETGVADDDGGDQLWLWFNTWEIITFWSYFIEWHKFSFLLT